MKNIIINADDFGLSDGICKSIWELFDCGAITSTSLMVAAPSAIERIGKWNGKLLVGNAGVHLQLTSGAPLSPLNEVVNLVDLSTGRFKDPRKEKLIAKEEVEREWRRQILAATDLLGGLPSHLDSHHGVHRIPELFPVYKKLANEMNIPMRGATSGAIAETIKQLNLKATIAIVRDWTGRSLNAEFLKDEIAKTIKSHPEERVIEIVAHPGYSDKYLEAVSSLAAFRENDHKVLTELARENWWKTLDYNLISYKEFGNGLI